MEKAILLDRDGTINIDTDYTHKIKDLRIIPKVIPALKLLQEDYKLIIITNQPGIARGYYTEEDYFKFRDELLEKLNKKDVRISAEYFCPHHPEKGIGKYKKNCNCRKPKTGMLEQAAREFNLNLLECWMIGDSPSDIQAGNNAGCRTIHVLTGQHTNPIEEADYAAKNLLEAAYFILS